MRTSERPCSWVERAIPDAAHGQGFTLVHLPAQLEPCLTQENTLHTLHTLHTLNTLKTPNTPLTRATQPLTYHPYRIQSAQVELKSGRV